MRTNKELREQLVDLYGHECAAGGIINKHNPLTLHHIDFKCVGGLSTLANTINLAHLEHSGIHILSYNEVYARIIKEYLLQYKEVRDYLAKQQFHYWMETELTQLGMKQDTTRDRKLIYRRRCD